MVYISNLVVCTIPALRRRTGGVERGLQVNTSATTSKRSTCSELHSLELPSRSLSRRARDSTRATRARIVSHTISREGVTPPVTTKLALEKRNLQHLSMSERTLKIWEPQHQSVAWCTVKESSRRSPQRTCSVMVAHCLKKESSPTGNVAASATCAYPSASRRTSDALARAAMATA